VFDHIAVQVSDVAAAATFYQRVLAPLGIREAMRFPRDGDLVVGLCGPDGAPRFWLGPSSITEPTRELHVAFSSPSREAVDEVHRAAVDAGAEVLHAPRIFPEYHPGYYAVFVRDLDGNNVEAVHHQQP
jgi:catechol 2,3-dioxygenase-like lactoylglutathione lyase family enzyme